MTPSFLARPGLPGPFGALMDEYARAAEDLCRTAERLAPGAFAAERPSGDPDCRSPRAVCEHAVFAAHGYANYLLRARGLPGPEPSSPEREAQRVPLASPADLRPALAGAIRRTEETVEPMRAWPDGKVAALRFPVSWGATYDPESMLEHAIVHLLRHRRQLERWG